MTIGVRVYGPSGTGSYTTLERVWGQRWTDEQNGPGVGQFVIHAFDAQATESLLAFRNVVKFVLDGTEVAGFIIRNRTRTRVSAGEAAEKVITVSGPLLNGLLAWLDVPYGFGQASPDARSFNYASLTAPGGYTWTTPDASTFSSDVRAPLVDAATWPSQLTDAQWIWPSDAEGNHAAGDYAFFRKTFTVANDVQVVIFSTGDNSLELYVDEERIVQTHSPDSYSWFVPNRHEMTLSAGTHIIAARVDNLFVTSPAGLLVSMHELTADAEPGTRILKSDSSWECFAGPTVPRWTHGAILRHLVVLNQTAGVTPANQVTFGFTATHDSAGVPWSTQVDVEFNVGENLLDVAMRLSEFGLDWYLGPDMVLHAWEMRGTDLSGSVELAEGENILELQVTSQDLLATRLRYRTDSGWHTEDSGASGVYLGFLSLGTAADDTTASLLVAEAFARYAQPAAEHSMESAILPGAEPYADFGVADTVSAPDEWGAVVPLRVRALTIAQQGERVTCVPEFLVED